MGRGRGKGAILATLGVAALALLGTGCGSSSHPNDPRPPLAAEVTVNITDSGVQAQPAAVGVAQGKNGAPQNQNAKTGEPSSKDKELIVIFTTSNTTNTNTTLEIHGPGASVERSGPVVAEGNDVYKVALPTGHYTLEAADLPGAKPAPFYVGPLRVSSQNDLLLP